MASTKSIESGVHHYKKLLMHFQWMDQKPNDFELKWLLLPCPKGRRVVVATREGETHIYTVNGFKIMSFQSHLPGGSKLKKNWQNETTVLDCIFSEEYGVIYVIDLISWKGHAVMDSTFFLQADFRFFWLKSKIEEIPELSEKTIHNPYTFLPTAPLPCTTENIRKVLEGDRKIEGLLFYQKEGVYQAGINPQVLWIKPFMIQEALSILVPDSYMAEKPGSYTDFASYAKKKNEEQEKEIAEKEKAEKEKSQLKEQQSKKEKKAQTKKKSGKNWNETQRQYGNYNQSHQIPSLQSSMASLSLSDTPERRPIGRGRGRAIFGQSVSSSLQGYSSQQSYDVIHPGLQEASPPPYPFAESPESDYQRYYDKSNYQQNYYQQEYDNYYADQGQYYDQYEGYQGQYNQNQQYGYGNEQSYDYQQRRNQNRKPAKDRQVNQKKGQLQKGQLKKESEFYGQYQGELMCSQWLTEVPQDFEKEWLMVPCPVGKRRRVVAQDRMTVAYNKRDVEVERFKSQLPGGHEHWKHNEQNHTVLDCIYSKADKTYYIIDLILWKGHDVRDSETGFRFYWLHSKLKEEPFIRQIAKLNQYVFTPLPNFPCDKDSLQEAMDGEIKFQLDGLLFYHKMGRYVSGSVNHVIWLKPYMLPEVLGVQVPEGYMGSKPQTYKDFESYIKQFQEENKSETKKTQKQSDNRSTTEIPQENDSPITS